MWSVFFQVIHDEIAAIKTRVNRTCTFSRNANLKSVPFKRNKILYIPVNILWNLYGNYERNPNFFHDFHVAAIFFLSHSIWGGSSRCCWWKLGGGLVCWDECCFTHVLWLVFVYLDLLYRYVFGWLAYLNDLKELIHCKYVNTCADPYFVYIL